MELGSWDLDLVCVNIFPYALLSMLPMLKLIKQFSWNVNLNLWNNRLTCWGTNKIAVLIGVDVFVRWDCCKLISSRCVFRAVNLKFLIDNIFVFSNNECVQAKIDCLPSHKSFYLKKAVMKIIAKSRYFHYFKKQFVIIEY